MISDSKITQTARLGQVEVTRALYDLRELALQINAVHAPIVLAPVLALICTVVDALNKASRFLIKIEALEKGFDPGGIGPEPEAKVSTGNPLVRIAIIAFVFGVIGGAIGTLTVEWGDW